MHVGKLVQVLGAHALARPLAFKAPLNLLLLVTGALKGFTCTLVTLLLLKVLFLESIFSILDRVVCLIILKKQPLLYSPENSIYLILCLLPELMLCFRLQTLEGDKNQSGGSGRSQRLAGHRCPLGSISCLFSVQLCRPGARHVQRASVTSPQVIGSEWAELLKLS